MFEFWNKNVECHCVKRSQLYYTVRHKNTPKFIDRNLKTDDQILIIFSMIISDTTCHQMFSPHHVCFCTTWRNQNKQNITFLFNAISLFDSINAHLAPFVETSSTLIDSLSNCPVVQL